MGKKQEPWRNRIVGHGEEEPSQLLGNEKNWRGHTHQQEMTLAGVFAEVGWVQSVIVNKRTSAEWPEGERGVETLVDGHLRCQMAISHGDKSIPVTYVDLTPAEEYEVLATFDPISGMAFADKERLDQLLRDVQSGDAAVQQMLAELAEKSGLQYGDAPPEDPGAQIDKAAELQEKWQTATGQLWQVGEHRILCGDSTKAEDVARVMGGEKAALFCTDPPYGIAYDSAQLHRNETHYDAIEQDEMDGPKLQAFLDSAFRAWLPYLNANAAWYLWHAMLTQGFFTAAAAAAAAAAVILSRQIIWIKPQMIFGHGEYHWKHELCFYGWRKGNRPPFYGERNQTTVWELGYDGNRNERDHPTQKPVAIFAIPMRNHTKTGEICAEPFAGSGSQFVAGEQEGRRVYGCEIEPKYVAVCLERLSMMGLHPELVT